MLELVVVEVEGSSVGDDGVGEDVVGVDGIGDDVVVEVSK